MTRIRLRHFQIRCNEWGSDLDLIAKFCANKCCANVPSTSSRPAVAVEQPAEFLARLAGDLGARRVGGRELVNIQQSGSTHGSSPLFTISQYRRHPEQIDRRIAQNRLVA